jgi:acetate kinase
MRKNILVINCGSSSIKFQLLDTKARELVIKGMAEELNSKRAFVMFKKDGRETKENFPGADFEIGMKRIFDELEKYNLKDTVKAVGHRVVNGGETIKESVIIDDRIIAEIEKATPFAPLHNPAQIAGIRAVTKVMPKLPQVAVFDTAFHQTMPEHAYRYAVPASWYHDHGVRRYGAHGTSFRFVARSAAKILKIPLERSSFVIAHLGNGASVAAVLNGRSIDTSMGFTPLEGLVMGTRSGNLDPAIIPFMKRRLGQSAEEILNILNKESGLLGLSDGLSSDLRDLIAAADNGNKEAKLAMEVQTFRVAKYVAAMMVSLPRVDALVFTGGAGERDDLLRARVAKHLKIFGYEIDEQKNKDTFATQNVISAEGTPLMLVVPTNEELMIAEDTAKLVKV